MAVGDDLAWAGGSGEHGPTLGEIFCLTFLRGVDSAEALRRMGGLPDTVATRTWPGVGNPYNVDGSYPDLALALPLGAWTVVFEPNGYHGSNLTPAVSRGTEAVSVLRHDYASPSFDYAVDGELITHFDPGFPTDRDGADPDRLLARMLDVGFTMTDEDEDLGGVVRSLRLIEQLTGALPIFEALTGPLTSAHIEP